MFAGALLLAAGCFALFPGDTTASVLSQAAASALVAAAAVGLSVPRAWRPPRAGGRASLAPWAAYTLLIGLAGGAPSLFIMMESGPVFVGNVFELLPMCLLVAVFDEGVFRTLALRALAAVMGAGKSLMASAVVSSALFGVLHLSVEDLSAASRAVALTQALLKPLQAALFAFFMAAST